MYFILQKTIRRENGDFYPFLVELLQLECDCEVYKKGFLNMCRYSYLYIRLPPSYCPSIRGNGGEKFQFLFNEKWKHHNFPIILYRQPLEIKDCFQYLYNMGFTYSYICCYNEN